MSRYQYYKGLEPERDGGLGSWSQGNGGHGRGDDDDDAGVCRIDFRHLGHDIPLPRFINQIEALIDHPKPRHIAAGLNAETVDTANLFWTYTQRDGLHVETRAGYLDTETGNGGFSLDVNRDGSWRLHFHGADTVIGHDPDSDCPSNGPPPPPDDNELVLLAPSTRSYNAVRGHVTVDGGTGWATVQGGVGDYLIGGTGTLGGGQNGKGNCALYSLSPGSILVDMENGRGYGGTAEGNILVNQNQVRGSLFSNVLIGAHTGSDMKSGGDNSLLISTGGRGYEMRPDGGGNVLVSTVGQDWVLFDPTKGWHLGDQNIMLGFAAGRGGLGSDGVVRGDFLDLRMLTTASRSNFHTGGTPADINDYVRIVDQVDGSHVMFDPYGNVAGAGVEILALKFVHNLDVDTLYARGNIVA